MFTKSIIFLTVILTVFFAHKTCAETNNSKGLLPNPIEIAKRQIEKVIDLIVNLVKIQFKILNDIRNKTETIIQNAINTAIKTIDVIMNETIGRMRRIFQNALDRGINIAECFILNMDKLRILRRKLIIAEVQCVTNQAGEFYEIIDGATKNFTSDLGVVFDLPKRLKKCILTITPISCITKIVDDIVDLQKAIPRQIFGTMLEIVDYLNGFDQRVHKCQFGQLRKAIEGTRLIIDDMVECVRRGEMPDDTINVIYQNSIDAAK